MRLFIPLRNYHGLLLPLRRMCLGNVPSIPEKLLDGRDTLSSGFIPGRETKSKPDRLN